MSDPATWATDDGWVWGEANWHIVVTPNVSDRQPSGVMGADIGDSRILLRYRTGDFQSPLCGVVHMDRPWQCILPPNHDGPHPATHEALVKLGCRITEINIRRHVVPVGEFL